MERVDLVVVGAGAGGMAVADAAVRRGASVAMVSDGPWGGDCTWTGCVPSKALIAAAAAGVDRGEALARARRAVEDVAATEGPEVFAARGVAVHRARARFLTRTELALDDGTRLGARRVVLATGARPLVPPIEGLREADPLTSDTLWERPGGFPDRLAVLGGGPIGVELAQALARLGVAVTLFEAEDRILGREEPETAALLARLLGDDGVDVRTGARVARVERRADGTVAVDAAGTELVADDVLVAIGRRPVTDGLDVDRAGVRLDARGFVVVDDRMATTAPGVFAVGDVTGRFPFTHGAHAQGLVAVAAALGPPVANRLRRYSTDAEPFVTFTDPEVARVGLTEGEAHERWGGDARVVVLPASALDRAMAEGRTEGFVKLVAAPTRGVGHRLGGRLVGASVVLPHAGELIHELSLAARLHLPLATLALATHAYPTWGMAVQQAVSGFFLDLPHGETRPARPA